MSPSWIQILIVVVLLVLLFGRNRISDLMGDVARGISSFRKGIQDPDGASADGNKPDKISAHDMTDHAKAPADEKKSTAKDRD
ncbi:MAG: twin-arginine translocase TatA/TatE family subunit [Hyphomicrobiales bacterium]